MKIKIIAFTIIAIALSTSANAKQKKNPSPPQNNIPQGVQINPLDGYVATGQISADALMKYLLLSSQNPNSVAASKLELGNIIFSNPNMSLDKTLSITYKNNLESLAYAITHGSSRFCEVPVEKNEECPGYDSYPAHFNVSFGSYFDVLANVFETLPAVPLCLAFQESELNPNARNKSSNALGIFQLMPYSESAWGEIANLVNNNKNKPEDKQSPIYKKWKEAWDMYIVYSHSQKAKSVQFSESLYYTEPIHALAAKTQGPATVLVHRNGKNNSILSPEQAKSPVFNFITGMTYFNILEEKLNESLQKHGFKISAKDYFSALVGAHNMGPTKFNEELIALIDKTGKLPANWVDQISREETKNHIKVINECMSKGVVTRKGIPPSSIATIYKIENTANLNESASVKTKPSKKSSWPFRRKDKTNPKSDKETIKKSNGTGSSN